MAQFETIINQIEAVTGRPLANVSFNSIGGGCINSAYRLDTDIESYFLKVNSPHLAVMFEAEARGLQEILSSNTIRVPEVICYGVADNHSYLVLNYIGLGALRAQSSAMLGQQLAALHKIEQPFFGWHIDNTIGSTPQINSRHHDWLIFWRDQRLDKQLQYAAANGFNGRLQKQGNKLMQNLDKILADHQPHPSLLHGDLWGGNAASDEHGHPVIFDPACYYGDRETDLAMTELFGGFSKDFFVAYNEVYPVDDGYQLRKTLYNLYHILNHLNLFGSGYLSQSESLLDRLIAYI